MFSNLVLLFRSYKILQAAKKIEAKISSPEYRYCQMIVASSWDVGQSRVQNPRWRKWNTKWNHVLDILQKTHQSSAWNMRISNVSCTSSCCKSRNKARLGLLYEMSHLTPCQYPNALSHPISHDLQAYVCRWWSGTATLGRILTFTLHDLTSHDITCMLRAHVCRWWSGTAGSWHLHYMTLRYITQHNMYTAGTYV